MLVVQTETIVFF